MQRAIICIAQFPLHAYRNGKKLHNVSYRPALCVLIYITLYYLHTTSCMYIESPDLYFTIIIPYLLTCIYSCTLLHMFMNYIVCTQHIKELSTHTKPKNTNNIFRFYENSTIGSSLKSLTRFTPGIHSLSSSCTQQLNVIFPTAGPAE